jgi:iron complex transport system ATP-binding protein
MSHASLAAHNVSFAYPRRADAGGTRALDDVSVTIERGSLTGLLGPNGCGKTTLLKILAGVLRPDEGRVTLDGDSLAHVPRRLVARRVAMVPQETHPTFDFSVLEMALMGRHPHLGMFELEGPRDLEVAREALAATGTAHLADRPYATLSGGEKQRVVIACALAQSAGVMLLDEPTASLDLGFQVEVASLLTRLNRDGVTMVVATHDLNLAAALCDSLVLMRDGRVVSSGPTPDVLTSPMVRRLFDVDADVAFHDRAGRLTVVALGRRP